MKKISKKHTGDFPRPLWDAHNRKHRRGLQKTLAEGDRALVKVFKTENDKLRIQISRESGKFEIDDKYNIVADVDTRKRLIKMRGMVEASGRKLIQAMSGAEMIMKKTTLTARLITQKSWASKRLNRIEDLAFKHVQRNGKLQQEFWEGAAESIATDEKKLLAKIESTTGGKQAKAVDQLSFVREEKKQVATRIAKAKVNVKTWKAAAPFRKAKRAEYYQEILKKAGQSSDRALRSLDQITNRIMKGKADFKTTLKKFNEIEFPSNDARAKSWGELKSYYEETRHEEELRTIPEEEHDEQYYVHRGPLDKRTIDVSRKYLGKIYSKKEWEKKAAADPQVPSGFNIWSRGLMWGERGHFDLVPPEYVESFGKRRLEKAEKKSLGRVPKEKPRKTPDWTKKKLKA